MPYTENEETIITAAMSLATVCDHATSQDGQGYNGRDAEFMHSVVRQHNEGRYLTQKQLQAMYKTLRTYKKQLSRFGINYDELIEPQSKTETITPSTGTIDPTWESFIIDFGKKHDGESLATVWKKDPDYVDWLAREFSRDNVRVAAQHVIAGKPIPQPEAPKPVDDVLGKFVINFGKKHKGETMGEIWLNDPDYIEWLAKESFMEDVKKAAQAIVENDPQEVERLKTVHETKKKLTKLSSATTSEFTMPDEFGYDKELYPYQKAGAEFLELSNGRGIIADTVGLGKSAQALSYLQNHPEARPAIIIAPASVKHQWYQYCYEWLIGDDLVEIISGTRDQFIGDIIILNYDILKKNLSALKKLNPQVIIYDEFHKIKNYKAQRTIAATEFAEGVPHVIMLSGTPIFNRTNELWSPLCMLAPDLYNKFTFHKWHKQYCGAHQTKYGWDFSGNTNTDKLAEELKHLMIRRTEEDVFDDLPELVRTVIPISITNRHIYNKAKEDHIAWIMGEKGKAAADKASRAEHLTRIEYLKQLVAEGKMKYAIQWIDDYLTSEDKLVIFTNHKSITNALMEKYGKIAVKIDGSTGTGQVRLDITNEFENNPKIKLFIGNMIAASEGLNLGVSKSVLFLEQGWSPKIHEQCEGRIKGLRQKGRNRNFIHSYYLVGYDTIDVEIAAMLEAKRQVADTAMGDTVKLDFNFFTNLVK